MRTACMTCPSTARSNIAVAGLVPGTRVRAHAAARALPGQVRETGQSASKAQTEALVHWGAVRFEPCTGDGVCNCRVSLFKHLLQARLTQVAI